MVLFEFNKLAIQLVRRCCVIMKAATILCSHPFLAIAYKLQFLHAYEIGYVGKTPKQDKK